MPDKQEDIMTCACGIEMMKFPEAYLCRVCDSTDIARLAKMYSEMQLKSLEQREQEALKLENQ